MAKRKAPGDWEIRTLPDGSLDEVCGSGFFHLEKMDEGHWWMALYDPRDDGRRININLTTRRNARITGGAELQGPS